MPDKAIKDHHLFMLMFTELQDPVALEQGKNKLIKIWEGIKPKKFHKCVLNPEAFKNTFLEGDEFQKNIYMDYILRIRHWDKIDDDDYHKGLAKKELVSDRTSERYLLDLYEKGWLGRRKEGRGYQYFVPKTFNHLVLAKVCEENGWLISRIEDHEWFQETVTEVTNKQNTTKEKVLANVAKAVKNYHKDYQLFVQMKAKEYFTNLWTDTVLDFDK